MQKHPDGPGNAKESLQTLQIDEFVHVKQSELHSRQVPFVVKFVKL
jgi:hypothetical protein